MENGHWKFPSGITNIPEGSIGFVYIITNLKKGKKYIGAKLLENKKKRKPLKGRKNARRHRKGDYKKLLL